MKTIIAGSRTITDYALVEEVIKEFGFEITKVISGMAKGVDVLGEKWAHNNNIGIILCPANWEKYKKSAGFIDVFQKVYTITVDTKVVSKVLEILLYPKLKEFADKNELELQLPKYQNHYPDATFICKKTNVKFAVDIKSTIRKTPETVNMMTLGAFTGYFRNRQEGEISGKNITYPYNDYSGHFVFGIIYTQNKDASDERKSFTLDELNTIPSVIHDFDFFVQPKYKIATSTPGSGNTKNIGSCTKIKQLKEGTGPFHKLGVEVFDDYWMFYLTEDMAKKDETERPYTNIITYLQYKKRFLEKIDLTPEAIAELTKEEEVDHD